jgi:hypothetical protein
MTPRVTRRILYKYFNVNPKGILSAPIAGTKYTTSEGKRLTVSNAVGATMKRIPRPYLCSKGYHAGTLAGWHGFQDERHLARLVKSKDWDPKWKAIYRVLLHNIGGGSMQQGKFVGESFTILKRVA